MQLDSVNKLSPTTIALHWFIAIGFIGIFVLGKYMDIAHDYSMYPIHKSLGVLIVLVVVPRLLWRYRNGLPKPLYDHSLQEKAATAVHLTLLAATILMPISGMMMSGFSGHGIPIFGFDLVAANPDPANPGEVIALNETLAEIGHVVHGALQWVIIVSLVLHIGGALKHHFKDKDGTLSRMLGKKV